MKPIAAGADSPSGSTGPGGTVPFHARRPGARHSGSNNVSPAPAATASSRDPAIDRARSAGRDRSADPDRSPDRAPSLNASNLNAPNPSALNLERLRAFHRISLLGSTQRPPAEIASRVLREFARTMGFRRAEICLLDKQRHLRRLASFGRVPVALDASVVPLRDCPLGRSLVRRRQAVLHASAAPGTPQRRICHLGWYGLTSLFGAPLHGPDGPLGLLLADRGGRPFEMSATDLEVATALAGLVAQVVKGAVAREAEFRRQSGLLLLGQAGRAISAEESLRALLPRLTRIVRAASKVLGVVVALYDEGASEFVVAAIAGPAGRYGRGFRFPGRPHRSCLSPRVMHSGRPLRLDDLRKAPEVCVYWPEARSTLVLPIRSKGKILGTLRLEDTERQAFDEEDVRLYSTVADQIGHAVRRARVTEALARKQSDLMAVSESLEKRLEEERRRIARELHDELAQSMTAARINLGLLRSLARGAAPEVRRAIRETESVVLHTIEETRRIAMDLRPAMLDELGLVPALRWYADTFARRTGVDVQVRANGGGGPSQRDVNTLLFRFFQEALTNVARHSHARHVQIGLNTSNGTLRAVVNDDGIGMKPNDPSHQGLGLIGMRERIERAGGVLRIRSRPGRGTRLVAEIPGRFGERGPGRSRRAAGSVTFEGGLS